MKYRGLAASPVHVSIYEVMTKPAITVPLDMNSRYASVLLGCFRILCTDVVSDGDMVAASVNHNGMVVKGVMNVI